GAERRLELDCDRCVGPREAQARRVEGPAKLGVGQVAGAQIGLGGERLNMYFMSGGQGKSFADAAKEMTERIRELGPNPLKE
ncbi:MAG: hydrogenase iron-sulfur subunit, partial [Anaerolineales bacterium]